MVLRITTWNGEHTLLTTTLLILGLSQRHPVSSTSFTVETSLQSLSKSPSGIHLDISHGETRGASRFDLALLVFPANQHAEHV